jgi:[ribosomal protein S18]-alanine N-acetyltransferase
MISTQTDLNIRTAVLGDRGRLASLVYLDERVHRHLDWKSALDWLGSEPFYVVESNSRIVGTLACPPDPPEIAWIRLFAAREAKIEKDVWEMLWPKVRDDLKSAQMIKTVAALPTHAWFRDLLTQSEFVHVHDVVMLIWEGQSVLHEVIYPPVSIRPMNYDDLSAVAEIDHNSFEPLWRNSLDALRVAFQQASIATVAEFDGVIVGYQISTSNSSAQVGHLARLAVLPRHQQKGIGKTLVKDLLYQFSQRGIYRVSVNTQNNNHSSLALYRKIGFRMTSEIYPLFIYNL